LIIELKADMILKDIVIKRYINFNIYVKGEF